MSIADAIRQALTGGRGVDSGGSLADRIGELKAQHGGSRRAVSRATGIPESTLRRMERTGRAGTTNVERMDRGVRSARLDVSLNDKNLKITAFDRKDNRKRTIDAKSLQLAPGTMDKVRAAFLAGDDKAATAALLGGIRNEWYRQWLTPGSELARKGALDRDDDGGGGAGKQGRRQGDTADGKTPSGGSGGGGGGGGGSDEGYWYDDDLSYEGEDLDTDYGANVGGIGA